mmetsp:Transcript_40406/g.129861  ORF Transcript_40406/g.129861 Transcript_40406/m.129861 type:complete len:500 (-) Transcript_40406:306-1805(-)
MPPVPSTSSAPSGDSSTGSAPSSLLQLARIIRRGDPVVFVTGSGLSAPSGIPTFRGAEGVWAKWVLEWGTRAAFLADPRGWYDNFWIPAHVVAEPGSTSERTYEPSAGHFAVAEVAACRQTNVHVITQNIDGLHQRAGLPSERLVEVHGRAGLLKCVSPGCRYAAAESIGPAQLDLATATAEWEADAKGPDVTPDPALRARVVVHLRLRPAGGGVRARRGPRVETADAARVLKARRRDRREPALPGELPQADEGPHLAAAPPVLEGRPRSRTPRSVPVPPGAERGAGSGVQEAAGGGAGWRSRPVLPLPHAEGGALAAAPDLGGGAHALDPNNPLRDVRPPLVERVQWRVGHESGRRLAEPQASRVPAQPLPKLGADAVAVDGRLQRGRRREPAGPRAPLVVVSCDGEDVAHPVEVVRPVLPPLEADPDLRVRPAVEHLDQLALPQRQGVLHLLPLEPRLPALVQQVVAKERRVLFVGDEGGGGAHGRGAGRPSRGPPR